MCCASTIVHVRKPMIGLLAVALAALACLAVWPAFDKPVHWTLDGFFYQARVLEFRGADGDDALNRVFQGPLSAELRAEDPTHTGNPRWVEFNEPFYERRAAVPAAAAAIYPVAGERSLLYVSLAGYIAAILALFGLLLLRFRVAIAAAVTIATIFLPPLTMHSSYPITDSWGLALEIAAFGAAVLTLDRGLRWLPLWIAAIALLGFTRDSSWIPILAVGWCAFRYRSREPVTLFATGVAAALPALFLFQTPVRDLLAMLVNHSQVPADTSWSFIISHYPRAAVDLVQANVGFLRRGEWYTTLYLVGGVLALLGLVSRRRLRGTWPSLMTAGAVVGLVYVLVATVFSAFRLELVFVPMAAFGLALTSELALARVSKRMGEAESLTALVPARLRR
jgi:hypothetical protein